VRATRHRNTAMLPRVVRGDRCAARIVARPTRCVSPALIAFIPASRASGHTEKTRVVRVADSRGPANGQAAARSAAHVVCVNMGIDDDGRELRAARSAKRRSVSLDVPSRIHDHGITVTYQNSCGSFAERSS